MGLSEKFFHLCDPQKLLYQEKLLFHTFQKPRTVTKFRIDTNCTLGSLLRNFRNNKIHVTDSTCVYGEGEQEIQ